MNIQKENYTTLLEIPRLYNRDHNHQFPTDTRIVILPVIRMKNWKRKQCLKLYWKLVVLYSNTFEQVQYIPRNMHTVFALLCFVVVMHWLIFPYRSGLLHWQCGNLTIAPVPAKQPWWILINTSCEFIMNDCITTTKQSTTKPCAYFLGYTVASVWWCLWL